MTFCVWFSMCTDIVVCWRILVQGLQEPLCSSVRSTCGVSVHNECVAASKTRHMAAKYDSALGECEARRNYLRVCVYSVSVVPLFVLMLQLNKLNPWTPEYAKVVSNYAHAFQKPILYNFWFEQCGLHKLTQKSKQFLAAPVPFRCSVFNICSMLE